MSVLFAMVTSLCAVVLAVLFVAAWRDKETAVTTALSAALLSVFILTMMAWEEAL